MREMAGEEEERGCLDLLDARMDTFSPEDNDDFDELPLNIPAETLEAIEDAKRTMPGLFVSGWEEDDEGVAEKDLMDPGEQTLTAAEDGDLQDLKRLIQSDPQLLQFRDADEYTCLHRAAYNDHAEAVQFLLEAGAEVGWRTENGWTPLHCAACWGSHHVVPLLLAHQADVNARSHGQLTPLHLAVACTDNPQGARKVVETLLSTADIDREAVSGAGETAAMIARRTSKAMVQLFPSSLPLQQPPQSHTIE